MIAVAEPRSLGALQLTDRLVVVAADTVGAAGAAGAVLTTLPSTLWAASRIVRPSCFLSTA